MRRRLNIIIIEQAVLIAVLLMCLCACSTTKVVTVEKVKTEEHTILDYAHDTLIIKDSIYVREKGDTVFVDRWHTRDRVLEVCRVDSFVSVDSIPYPVEVIVEKSIRDGRYTFYCTVTWCLIVTILLTSAIWFFKKTPYGKVAWMAIKALVK